MSHPPMARLGIDRQSIFQKLDPLDPLSPIFPDLFLGTSDDIDIGAPGPRLARDVLDLFTNELHSSFKNWNDPTVSQSQ